jgi:hypothetical protein
MTDVPMTHALRGIALLLASLFFVGCASTPMSRARTVLAVTAEAVVSVDRILAGPYAALAAAENPDPDRVQRWNAVVTTLLLSRSALLTAERSLDAVEAGQAGDIRGVLSCVASAVTRLVEALPEIGVDVPDALMIAMQMIGGFAGTCEPEHETSTWRVPHVSEAIAVAR